MSQYSYQSTSGSYQPYEPSKLPGVSPAITSYGTTFTPSYQATTTTTTPAANSFTTPSSYTTNFATTSYTSPSYGAYVPIKPIATNTTPGISANTPSYGVTSNTPLYSNTAQAATPSYLNNFNTPGAATQATTPSYQQPSGVKSVTTVQSNVDEKNDNSNFRAIADRKIKEANRPQYEGEAYDPLKKLSQEQIEAYGKQGINDYLTCLRLSTKSQIFTKYDNTLKTLEIQGAKDYKDDEFPPELQSLVGVNQAGRNSWKGLKWIRPKDIAGYQSAQVIQGIIEPNDIRQGYLGDCYFLSTLASLAEWPDRIKALFTDDKPNPYGCHCVRVCDKGEWKQIIIDEFFPCISSQRGPAFTKGNQGEIWVMLLEKAWAKINGSYDGIEAGLTRECLHDFTGAPTQTLWLDDQSQYEKVWNKLLEGEANNYAMTCGSTDKDSIQEVEKAGIISGHAYSLLGAYTVNYQGKAVRLVKLRNPWGEKEWNGNWKDGDSKFQQLSSQDIQKLDIANRGQNGSTDDGIFFMEYDDFRQYFTDAQICYVFDDFKYTSIRASSLANKAKFFKMTVTKKGRYFISINQKSKRKYPKDFQKEFKYSTATVVVAKERKDGTFQYIEGQQKEDREVWTSEKDGSFLEPGVYYVYAKVQWKYNQQEDFVLSSYGAAETVFTEVTKVESQKFISEAYFDHAKNVSTRPKKQLENGQAWILVEQTDDGFFYLAVENKTQKTMDCEFKLNKMNGLKLRKPFRGQNVKIQLKPGSHEAAVLRVKDYRNISGLSVSQTISFK